MNDLISRKQTIEHLKKRLWETALNNEGEAAEVFAWIADDRLDTWMAEIQPEQQWIPVSEGLPKETGLFLVTITNKVWDRGEWHENTRIQTEQFFESDGRFFTAWYDANSQEKITAWMPLPEPYKEVK